MVLKSLGKNMKTIKTFTAKEIANNVQRANHKSTGCYIMTTRHEFLSKEDVLGLIDELEPRQIDDGDWPAWEDLIEELKKRIEG